MVPKFLRIYDFERYLTNKQATPAPYFDIDEVEEMFHYYLDCGLDDYALLLLDYAAEQHPDTEAIDEMRIEYLLHEGKAAEALELINQLKEEDDDSYIYSFRVSALAQLGRIDEADYWAKKMLEDDKESVDTLAFNIAVSYTEAGIKDKAIYYFLLSKQANPNCIDTLWALSDCYLHLPDLRKALDYTEQVIEAEPYFASAWDRKAYILYQLHQLREAYDATEYALAIDPYYTSSLFTRLLIETDWGQTDKYRQTIDRIVEYSDQPDTDLNFIIELMNNLSLTEDVEYCKAKLQQLEHEQLFTPDHSLSDNQ